MRRRPPRKHLTLTGFIAAIGIILTLLQQAASTRKSFQAVKAEREELSDTLEITQDQLYSEQATNRSLRSELAWYKKRLRICLDLPPKTTIIRPYTKGSRPEAFTTERKGTLFASLGQGAKKVGSWVLFPFRWTVANV
jgi:hypothetical protein